METYTNNDFTKLKIYCKNGWWSSLQVLASSFRGSEYVERYCTRKKKTSLVPKLGAFKEDEIPKLKF